MTNETESDPTGEESPDRSERARSAEGSGHPSASDVTETSPMTAAGFFAALSEGTLLGGRCDDCDTVLLPPRPVCYDCGGRNVDIEEQPKRGTVVSHTRIHKSTPAFSDIAPFPVAIVELDSGGRLPGRVDVSADELSIGDSVRVAIREPTDADREFALDHEQGWPIHEFVPERGD